MGRPSSPLAPGPVNDLTRPSIIPLVHGWYRGMDIAYLDFGSSITVAAPILAFFHAEAPDSSVVGQKNIIDTIPGLPGYSDFWRVYKVVVPSTYVVNSIRSFEEAVASGYPVQATDLVVNCPVVNPNATIQGHTATPTQGWFRDREVFYFDLGTNTHAEGFVVNTAPIYAFFYSDGSQVADQRNVIGLRPSDPGYSDLWQVVKVIVDPSYVANSLNDTNAIMMESAAGLIRLETTGMYVNCPVVATG